MSKDDPTQFCGVYDLQKVIALPCGGTSLFFYKRKLAVYNFTVFYMGKKTGFCYVWHEGIASRGPNEIGSCVYNFLDDHGSEIKHATFYSDNCGGQNRNKYIAMMYLKAVTCTSIQSITHKFLEQGHTQNEGDSMHATIENSRGNHPIYSPQQFYLIARMAKKTGAPYVVKEMTEKDFLDWKELNGSYAPNWTVNEEGQSVKWTDIKIWQLRKEAPQNFFYKTSYLHEEFQTINVCHKRRARRRHLNQDLSALMPSQLYHGPRPIAAAKYKDLQELCTKLAIPREYHDFYNDKLTVAGTEADDDDNDTDDDNRDY